MLDAAALNFQATEPQELSKRSLKTVAPLLLVQANYFGCLYRRSADALTMLAFSAVFLLPRPFSQCLERAGLRPVPSHVMHFARLCLRETRHLSISDHDGAAARWLSLALWID